MTTAKRHSQLRDIKIFSALRGVKPADLPSQIIAGITLAALMIPLNIGYAQVAGLPAVVGLYASIVPMIFFGLFSTSRNLIAGPDAPIAALIGSALVTFAAVDDPRYIELAFGLALLTGACFLIFWLFRMGFLANFLSKAVLVGFISGLGIEVLTSQVQKVMGIHVEADRWIVEVWEMIKSIPQANIYSVIIGVGAIVLIRVLKRYTPKIPGALVALILATLIVSGLGWEELGVSVLGKIPAGLPTFHIPKIGFYDYVSLLPVALAVVGITMAEGLLVARKYANKYRDSIDSDNELFAFGAANIATGFTGGFVVGTSASRTAAMDNSGMRSQIPSLVGAIVVAIVLLFLTNLLALVPNAVLAGIVANAVLALIEIKELRIMFRLRQSEFWIAIVCVASVLALGPLMAVVIAFLLSTINVVRKASNPYMSVLRPLADGSGYFPCQEFEQYPALRGLLIFRFGDELFFANTRVFQERVNHLIESADPALEWFVLDVEAINDLDISGAEALEDTINQLQQKRITFVITRAEPPLVELLEHYDLIEKIGKERLYPTNRSAVKAFLDEKNSNSQ